MFLDKTMYIIDEWR